MLVSEHTLNTTFKAYYESGQFFIQSDVKSVFIKSMFSNFEDVYGDDFETVKIKISAEKQEPSVKMSNGNVSLSADFKLSIMNPLNP